MGSKNRILLGFITNIIIHNIRNTFKSKDLYITKRKLRLIKIKHPNEFQYIKDDEFQTILNNTIASFKYKKDKTVLNFISNIDNKFILFGISNNSYYIHLSTLFYPSKKQLKNFKDSMRFFSPKDKIYFEKYIENKN